MQGARPVGGWRDEASPVTALLTAMEEKDRLHPTLEEEVLRRAKSPGTPIPAKEVWESLDL